MIEEVEIDLHDVVDEDEVATLLTRPVSAGGFEQSHALVGCILIAKLPHDRSHASLVLLTRTVHVEVTESRNL